MVCSAYNRVVMERNTDIDELAVLEKNSTPESLGTRYAGAQMAIALAPQTADFRLVRATRAKERYGYTYVRRYLARVTAPFFLTKLALSHADPQICERDPHCAVKHEVDQLLDVVALAGATTRIERLRIDLTAQDRAAVAYLPPDPIVVHLGLRWFGCGSTLHSTMTLIRELRRFGAPVVVTHGVECAEQAAQIAEAGVADAVVGDLPFHAWAAAFERARAVVTVDTGATHVASAMRRPTVVVFEHRFFRLSSQEWAPYRVPSVLIRKPADDAPAGLAHLRGEVIQAVDSLIHA